MEQFLITDYCAVPFSEIIKVFEGHANFESIYIDKHGNFYKAPKDIEAKPYDLTPCNFAEIDLNGAIVNEYELPALLELGLVQLPKSES